MRSNWLRKLAHWRLRSENNRLRKRIAELETQLVVEKRKVAVAQAEVELLAAVVARDRRRVEAECAAFARQQAEAEGVANGPTS